jgi:hypothetical protein
MISGRWGEVQERQLAAFERASEPMTGYETGALAALRVIAPDDATRDRIDRVTAREQRRDREARARRDAKLVRNLDGQLDRLIERQVDRALARGRL